MGFPYTDVNSTYDCEELSSTLLDGTANPATKNMVPQNAPGSKADGMFGRARGPLGESKHFRRNVDLDGSQFDCRGLVSISIVAWVRVTALTTQPYTWSVWDAVNGNGQAWILGANWTGGVGGQSPVFLQYDGLTVGNQINVKATTSAANMTANVWHMIGGSYNHVTNTLGCFWGDGNDGTGSTTYHSEISGFAAGFGFTTDYQSNNVARFRLGGAVADVLDIDNVSYWKGRAFDSSEFLDHWQSGNGLIPSQFASDPSPAIGRIIAATVTGRVVDTATLTCRPVDSKNV